MRKFTIEEVKDLAEKQGQELLSEEYINSYTKLRFLCPEGHEFAMSFNHFQQGYRCPICAGVQKHTIEYVKEFAERQGQSCLSKNYVNNHTKLQFRCPEGHIYEMTFSCFKQGQRCPICAINNRKLTIEQVKGFVEGQGQTCISNEYVNSQTKLQFRCPEGHIYEMKFNDFQQGHLCPICASQQATSKAEKEVLAYVESIYKGTILPNNKEQITNPRTGYGLELDIYMPDLKFAIEYNGTYWHSEPYQKYKDEQKLIQCQQKGIYLLVILEEEWVRDKEECKNRINDFLTIRG